MSVGRFRLWIAMITQGELFKVGKLLKPHGIGGEIVALVTEDVELSDVSCIILDMDGIYVPFFIDSVRQKSSETDLIGIDGIDSEAQAAGLSGRDIYVKREEMESSSNGRDGFYADDLVGFSAVAEGKTLGKIVGVDTSTANCLFIVEKPDGSTCLIPVADEFIESLDPDGRLVGLSLPEGLLSL